MGLNRRYAYPEMARKDRTFTVKDIERFINNNLSDQEFVSLIILICKGVKIQSFEDIEILVPILAVEQGITEVNLINSIIKIVKTAFGK